MKSYLLLLLYFTITLCQEVHNEINKINSQLSYLTSNYTIDFIRNIKPQKCYSNNECPHYSNGCVISFEMFKDKNIPLEDNNIIENFSKEDLIKNGIYGFCSYYYYCTENKDNTIQNNNCIVIETSETIDSTSYKTSLDVNLNYYNLKPGFVKNNITSPYHCNEDSIKNKFCERENYPCIENNNCLSKNCANDIHQCLNSEDFYVYYCENNNKCKKIDHEYCNTSSECYNNFSVNGYCLSKLVFDDIHRYDNRDMFWNVLGIGLIIIIILIIVCLCICFIKVLKSCSPRKK